MKSVSEETKRLYHIVLEGMEDNIALKFTHKTVI